MFPQNVLSASFFLFYQNSLILLCCYVLNIHINLLQAFNKGKLNSQLSLGTCVIYVSHNTCAGRITHDADTENYRKC